eukprot:CAMPEP_0184316740 /NCGR_PEP_ID=MMETSP1049-20130417/92199_1 /TAXON_ID=77928 /ORGANISM="Proteomonas sulcata, Strain CCMP704" /LENGTH=102 /DNA_ID=CAMNT_0026635861 /DNA_START=264 /DNA_END=572 /DNA_ORIENTATION=-
MSHDAGAKYSSTERISSARILLKIAESGGIQCLQEHEGDLVNLLASINSSYDMSTDGHRQLAQIMGSIMHALVPTDAPYIKALEDYDPLPAGETSSMGTWLT